MRRRTFIGLAGAAATSAWPLPTCAQQDGRVGAPENTVVTAPNGQWWMFEGPLTNGTYINGDPWVYDSGGGVVLTAVSTMPTGTGTTARNGGMVNPSFNTFVEGAMGYVPHVTSLKHGYDGRANQTTNNTMEYDEAHNAHANLPLTLNAGDSLVSAVSYSPATNEATLLAQANAKALERMACVTVVDHIPEADEFRPAYFGTNKIRWRFSDANLALLPDLEAYNPKGVQLSDFNIDEDSIYFGGSQHEHPLGTNTDVMHQNALRDLQYWIINYGADKAPTLLKPFFNMFWYPRDSGAAYGRIAMYVMCDFEDRDFFLKRLLQVAIDSYAIAAGTAGYTAPFAGGAGFFASPLWPIRLAGLLFDDTDMKNAVSISTGNTDFEDEVVTKWGEINRVYYSEDAHAQYLGVPGEPYAGGFPLFGDSPYTDVSSGQGDNGTTRDPDRVYDMHQYNYALPHANYPDILDDTYEIWKVGAVEQTNLGTYQNMTFSMMGSVLASLAMGDEAFWGGAVVDFAYRHANDPQMWNNSAPNSGWGVSYDYDDAFANVSQRDIFGHGGSGNGWMAEMWDLVNA